MNNETRLGDNSPYATLTVEVPNPGVYSFAVTQQDEDDILKFLPASGMAGGHSPNVYAAFRNFLLTYGTLDGITRKLVMRSNEAEISLFSDMNREISVEITRGMEVPMDDDTLKLVAVFSERDLDKNWQVFLGHLAQAIVDDNNKK